MLVSTDIITPLQYICHNGKYNYHKIVSGTWGLKSIKVMNIIQHL